MRWLPRTGSFALFNLCIVMLMCSCGQRPIESKPKVNITVNPADVEYTQAKTIFDYFAGLAPIAKASVPVSDVINLMKLIDKTIGDDLGLKVEANFPNGMDLTCKSSKCVGTAKGLAMHEVLTGVEISGVKDPEIFIDKLLEIRFKIDGISVLEVCKVQGIKVKATILAPFDGAYLELDTSAVKKLMVDLGLFGQYPSKDCDI